MLVPVGNIRTSDIILLKTSVYFLKCLIFAPISYLTKYYSKITQLIYVQNYHFLPVLITRLTFTRRLIETIKTHIKPMKHINPPMVF